MNKKKPVTCTIESEQEVAPRCYDNGKVLDNKGLLAPDNGAMTIVFDKVVASGGLNGSNFKDFNPGDEEDFYKTMRMEATKDPHGKVICSIGSIDDIPDFKEKAGEIKDKLKNGGFLYQCQNYADNGECLLDPFYGMSIMLDPSLSGKNIAARPSDADKVIEARDAAATCMTEEMQATAKQQEEAAAAGDTTIIVNRYYYPWQLVNPLVPPIYPFLWPVGMYYYPFYWNYYHPWGYGYGFHGYGYHGPRGFGRERGSSYGHREGPGGPRGHGQVPLRGGQRPGVPERPIKPGIPSGPGKQRGPVGPARTPSPVKAPSMPTGSIPRGNIAKPPLPRVQMGGNGGKPVMTGPQRTGSNIGGQRAIPSKPSSSPVVHALGGNASRPATSSMSRPIARSSPAIHVGGGGGHSMGGGMGHGGGHGR